jgi:hypothetical protein
MVDVQKLENVDLAHRVDRVRRPDGFAAFLVSIDRSLVAQQDRKPGGTGDDQPDRSKLPKQAPQAAQNGSADGKRGPVKVELAREDVDARHPMDRGLPLGRDAPDESCAG